MNSSLRERWFVGCESRLFCCDPERGALSLLAAASGVALIAARDSVASG